ncbi:MAG: molybdenum cofactor guanylyltransferase MobA [Hyphomicrobiales bacterium]
MKQSHKTLGVVLAGGQSRRMGNVDKTLMSFNGVSLTQHALNRIASQVDQSVINTNADPTAFEELGVPVLPDTVQGYAGPLAGILTAMKYAHENQFSMVASVAADTPFFPKDLVARFLAAGTHDIILAGSGGHRQPTFGLWSAALMKELEQFLTDGDERKIMRFVQRYSWASVEFDAQNLGEIDPFFNINTPEDMEHAVNYMNKNEVANA